MILVVAANPSIDKAAVVEKLERGRIHRPRQLVALPGGKGINVARAIQTLGGKALVVGLVAGHSGRFIEEGLQQERIPADLLGAEGETRSCLSILDRSTGELTEIYERGPSIDAAVWERFVSLVESHLKSASLLILSGSLPPGAPENGYAPLMQRAIQYGVRAIVDTHGPPLLEALRAKSYLVKLNREEAGELWGRIPADAGEALGVAGRVRERGALIAVVSLGAEGAVAATPDNAWWAQAPPVQALAAVGSGDALTAGMAVALERGEPLVEALRLGVAVGAANALRLGPGVFSLEEARRILSEVKCVPL